MGVYINIEIPTTCEKCNLESFCDKWIEARKMCGKLKFGAKANIRHPECPLIPIPPHGRLIDADALGTPGTIEEDTLWRGRIETEVYLASTIYNAPTIIPATNKE